MGEPTPWPRGWPPGGLVTGRINQVVVSWTVNTPDGPRSKAIDLETMRRHCRPERVDDLLDDLQVLCGDVEDGRDTGRRAVAPLRSVR